MFDISFEVGGRKVSPNRLGNEMEKAMLSEIADNVKRSLSSVQCPVHGQRPKVKAKGQSMNNLCWEVEGCCQDLVDKALKKLK